MPRLVRAGYVLSAGAIGYRTALRRAVTVSFKRFRPVVRLFDINRAKRFFAANEG